VSRPLAAGGSCSCMTCETATPCASCFTSPDPDGATRSSWLPSKRRGPSSGDAWPAGGRFFPPERGGRLCVRAGAGAGESRLVSDSSRRRSRCAGGEARRLAAGPGDRDERRAPRHATRGAPARQGCSRGDASGARRWREHPRSPFRGANPTAKQRGTRASAPRGHPARDGSRASSFRHPRARARLRALVCARSSARARLCTRTRTPIRWATPLSTRSV
jgi:hypothetical protein